jgi:uncharacterized protein (TIRG00374 family)
MITVVFGNTMDKTLHKIPWSWIIGIVLVGLIGWLGYSTRAELSEAVYLLQTADRIWVAIAFATIILGFVTAGLIYGSVLAVLDHNETFIWLAGTALVGILLNQTVPMGSVAAYAFLVAALRRRGFPSSSVAIVAGTELLSWNGAALLLFSGGLLYITITANYQATLPIITALLLTTVIATTVVIAVTRPTSTVLSWLATLRRLVGRAGIDWETRSIELVVEEIGKSRSVFSARPWRLIRIILLQMLIFVLHAAALTALLYSVRLEVPYFDVLAAYGMSLIVSLFTILPGGGGAVEAALSFTLHLQDVPLKEALSAAILFRLLSFWLMLPVGAVFYRILTRPSTPKKEHVL